jgi:hypothetical protein
MPKMLSPIEIKILFKCGEKLLSKSLVTQLYKKIGKEKRDQAIQDLINAGFITEKLLPKPGANKTPTFYEITVKGKKWVEQYLNNYPK